MSCPDCFKGAIHDHAEPQGQMETLYGLKTYVAGSKGSTTSKSSILYLPDAFSLKLVNNKLLADRYAAGTGCRVLIPDVVNNGGVAPEWLPIMDQAFEPLPNWSVGAIFAKARSIFTLIPGAIYFILFNGPDRAQPKVLQYALAMRNDLPEGGKLGVAGFCWGGYGATNLCVEAAGERGEKQLIDAAFSGHPSGLKAPDMPLNAIAKFKVPLSYAVASEDFVFSEKVALKTEAVVREKVGPPEQNNYEFRVYKDCHHGFCVRAKPGTKDMDGYYEAAKQAVDWFNKYLN